MPDEPAPTRFRPVLDGSAAARWFVIDGDEVFASLPEVLAARFPVCRAIVGEPGFRTMAALYAELCPPRSRILIPYGDDFGDFIDFYPPARIHPYLGDVARLEAARTRASRAAAADPIAVEVLASMPPCCWEQTRGVLHPSVQVVTSAYPIVSIWEAHAGADRRAVSVGAPAEDALIARPGTSIEIRRLPPGGAVFLSSLLDGATFREAAERSAESDPRADPVASLASLFTSRMVIGLSRTGPLGPAHPRP